MNELEPISFAFVAEGFARLGRLALAGLKPSQINKQLPTWKGHGGTPDTGNPSIPITDRSEWEDRFVLTELTLYKTNNEQLVINDAVLSVSQEKHIVRTSLVGLAGTIKEYISDGDYAITIDVGIVAVEDGKIVDKYPQEGIKTVQKFLTENTALTVVSPFLSMFDIKQIVITGFSLEQDTASNRQTMQVTALSDINYTIENTKY